jgi:hypothetical protein
LILFHTTSWNTIRAEAQPGETGTAYIRILEFGGVRVRTIEYSPRYKGNHWCYKGHIAFCIEGQLVVMLESGAIMTVSKSMSFQASDDPANGHRIESVNGCKLFVVDGDFLQLK